MSIFLSHENLFLENPNSMFKFIHCLLIGFFSLLVWVFSFGFTSPSNISFPQSSQRYLVPAFSLCVWEDSFVAFISEKQYQMRNHFVVLYFHYMSPGPAQTFGSLGRSLKVQEFPHLGNQLPPPPACFLQSSMPRVFTRVGLSISSASVFFTNWIMISQK